MDSVGVGGVPMRGELRRAPIRRITVDTSVLAGDDRRVVVAAVATKHVRGFWRHWISAELVRTRTEWIAEKAVRDGCSLHELRQREARSAQRVNSLINDLTQILEAVDYGRAPEADLSWLEDEADWPIVQTALAAEADALVTTDRRHFPNGEIRNGILILDPRTFLDLLYDQAPDARKDITDWLLLRGSPQEDVFC